MVYRAPSFIRTAYVQLVFRFFFRNFSHVASIHCRSALENCGPVTAGMTLRDCIRTVVTFKTPNLKIKKIKKSNINHNVELARQNSRHFATPPLVTLRNDVLETKTVISH